MLIPPNKFAKATLRTVPNGTQVNVHFNPTTLTYTVENSAKQTSEKPKATQYVAQFSGKLTMDLQFDTTHVGTDVRLDTNKVAAFMQPAAASGGTPSAAPPELEFAWGTYRFTGMMESFKETVDFFSADGVALRAVVSISLSRLTEKFKGGPAAPADSGSIVPTGAGGSAASAAQQGGDPSAARQLGTANDLESLRFSGGAALQVGGGVQLNAAAGFAVSASAGASAGFGVSAGVGVSGGIGISGGIGASGGIGISGGGGPPFGAAASAGVSATAGAFAGLEIGRATISSTTRLDPSLMLASTIGSDVSTSAGASFSLGGSANSIAAIGLSADVGARLSFDGE